MPHHTSLIALLCVGFVMAFALGMLLFLVTLILNVIALYVVRKYREEYE